MMASRGDLVPGTQVSIIAPGELGPDEIAAWHRMQKATPALADPFLAPEYAMAVGRFRPRSRVAVLTDGQSIVGFFPFEERRLGTGVPISGWLSACQGVIHEPDLQWDMGALLRGCGLSAWHFDNLIADQAARWPEHVRTALAPVIDLKGGFDYERMRERDKRFCRELERKTRKLAREAGELRLERDCTDPALLRVLMTWKSEQYQETRHVDRFAHPWVTDLLEAILTERHCNLSGLLSVLYAGDEPVSIQFGLRAGGILAGWFTGYNQEFASYSPGLIQLRMMTEALGEIGIDTLQMGTGAKDSARAFRTRDIEVGAGTVTTRSVLGLTHRLLGGVGEQALGTVRSHPALHHAADQVLRRSGVSSRFYGKV
jgi:CelD/BcsL family acetyltransferase involved in cellulose biosynthesis